MIGVASWVAPAVADDLPAPGEVRLFWEVASSKAPPGVPREHLAEWWIREIVPMEDGGILVSAFRDSPANMPSLDLGRTYFIRLNSDGTERWRANRPVCNKRGSLLGCELGDMYDTRIAPMPDGGFFAFLGGNIWEFDRNGIFLDSDSMPSCVSGHMIPDAAQDYTFYFASNCRFSSDDKPGGALVRWAPDCSDCWRMRLPLHADGDWQYGYGLDLNFLADGNLLWTIYGNPPMTLDPSTRWQVRVTPTGQIVPPGPLETSLQNEHGAWTLFASALLPDARLIRLGRYPGNFNDQPIRLEFWDGTGSQRLAWRILDFGRRAGLDYDGAVFRPTLYYLDARGSSAFYLASADDEKRPMADSFEIAGFDSQGNIEWQKALAIDGRFAVGDGASSRVYIATHVGSWPERRTISAIYTTTVE